MNRMHVIAAAGLVALAAACSEPAPPPAPTPTAATGDQRVKFYADCWNHFNNKAWDQFQNCYTDNAVSEAVDSATPPSTGRAAIIERDKQEAATFSDRRGDLQLVLGNGSHVVGVAVYTATNDGPMTGPDGKPMPATKKKIGMLMAHAVELDAMGTHAAKDSAYIEEGTVAGQLGLSPQPVRPVIAASGAAATVVVAKNDAAEAKNVAIVQALVDAANKHDLKATEALMADDYKLVEVGQQKDLDKKAALASNKDFLVGFPDIKMTAIDLWAAGDYVVLAGRIEGTNSGAMPAMGIVKATGKKFTGRFIEICKIENGKVKEDWLFYNSSSMATQLGLK